MKANGARNMIASAMRMLWSAIAISARLRRTARGGRRRTNAAAGAGAGGHLDRHAGGAHQRIPAW